ncbi:MAG: hypothetical protein JO147_04385 [Actinobacteria bacterium]|nr:hypothetical protein [Actinomycetota bacterium]
MTDAGVEGNSRLTAVTGAVLFVLLAIEGWTIPQVRPYLTLHVFVGVLLVGPILLKIGATGYRFIRYYARADPYVRRGPPHPVLRVLGPLVILSSLVVLASGIALILVGRGSAAQDWLITTHQASFIVWIVVTSVHVLGHVRDTVIGIGSELRDSGSAAVKNRRRTKRALLIALALLAGTGLAIGLTPLASSWSRGDAGRHIHYHVQTP